MLEFRSFSQHSVVSWGVAEDDLIFVLFDVGTFDFFAEILEFLKLDLLDLFWELIFLFLEFGDGLLELGMLAFKLLYLGLAQAELFGVLFLLRFQAKKVLAQLV